MVFRSSYLIIFLCMTSSGNAVNQFLVTITGANTSAVRVLERLQDLVSSLNGRAFDIDECKLFVGLCNVNATCENTLGSFQCQCGVGYTLEGNITSSCADLNECKEERHNCSVYANCINYVGSFGCACLKGFQGNGYHCYDTDECSSDVDCGDNAHCDNTVGSFECKCNVGFTLDKPGCSDVDECKKPDMCGEHAMCNNTAGSYICSCIDGYTGDGRICSDVNECSFTSCGNHSSCQNTNGSYQCNCDEGYTSNEQTCTDVNECSEDEHDCNTTSSVCVNTAGGYQCACVNGYEKNENICDKIPSVDKCSTGQNDCHELATCHTTIDNSYICVCNETTYDNNTQGRLCEHPFEITCTPEMMSIRVISSYYKKKNIHLENLHLADFSCFGNTSVTSEEHWEFNIQGDLTSCYTTVVKNSTHISYLNKLTNAVKSGVFVGTMINLPFSCSYPSSNINVSLPTPYYSQTNVITISGPNGTGTFVVGMNIFTDSSYTTVSNNTIFASTDFIFIQVKLTADDSNLILLVRDCWATPSGHGNDPDAYTFIANGCPIPGAVAASVKVTANGVGKVVNFYSQVFGFVDFNTTFLHCTVDLCSSSAEQLCTKDCPSRSPRYAGNFLDRTKREINNHLLSLGPFRPKPDLQSLPNVFQRYKILICGVSGAFLLGMLVVAFAFSCRRKSRKKNNPPQDDDTKPQKRSGATVLENRNVLPMIVAFPGRDRCQSNPCVCDCTNL